MSLISVKNFIAPLTNAVNLATIIVVAVVFGIYRLSGGGISISSRKTPPAVIREDATLRKPHAEISTESAKTDQVRVEPARAQATPVLSDDKIFGDLLDNGGKTGSLRDPAKPRTPSKTGGSSLDDIAKQLGVE